MVITDHLIIYLQLLTGRVCACIRIDRSCTHRTIVVCTTYGDNPAFLSCSSSNSSMNSIKSTSISTSSCSPSPRATRPARAALQQLQLQPAGIRRCAEWRPTPTYRISTCRSRRGRSARAKISSRFEPHVERGQPAVVIVAIGSNCMLLRASWAEPARHLTRARPNAPCRSLL